MSNSVNFDNVVVDMKCIKLETNDSVLFSGLRKMRVFKNKIYIFDSMVTKRVYIYDVNGTHIKTINNQGRANNEFIAIDNFEIDYNNEELILCDENSKKLLYYNLNGEFKHAVPIMWRMEDYAVLPNGNFIRGRNAMSHRISTTEPNSNHWLIISDSLTAINKICEHNILIEIPNYLVPSFNGDISFYLQCQIQYTQLIMMDIIQPI